MVSMKQGATECLTLVHIGFKLHCIRRWCHWNCFLHQPDTGWPQGNSFVSLIIRADEFSQVTSIDLSKKLGEQYFGRLRTTAFTYMLFDTIERSVSPSQHKITPWHTQSHIEADATHNRTMHLHKKVSLALMALFDSGLGSVLPANAMAALSTLGVADEVTLIQYTSASMYFSELKDI